MPDRITAFLNQRDEQDYRRLGDALMKLVEMGVRVGFAPASGCHSIWVHRKYMGDGRERETADALYGPTAISSFLSRYLSF